MPTTVPSAPTPDRPTLRVRVGSPGSGRAIWIDGTEVPGERPAQLAAVASAVKTFLKEHDAASSPTVVVDVSVTATDETTTHVVDAALAAGATDISLVGTPRIRLPSVRVPRPSESDR